MHKTKANYDMNRVERSPVNAMDITYKNVYAIPEENSHLTNMYVFVVLVVRMAQQQRQELEL